MSNTESDSHSQVVVGTGATAAAAITLLGAITLPANGPWNIWGIWGYAVANAANAAEAVHGDIQIVSVSGDITPNPAPSRWPLASQPSYLGAATGKPLVPVTISPVLLEASGKAIANLNYIQHCARTAADVVAAGLLYGKTVPEFVRPRFCDSVTAAFKAVGTNVVGTITLAEKATRIVAIECTVVQDNVSTATEEILPYWIMSSDDIDFPPSQWPCSFASNIGLATNHGLNNAIRPDPIVVNIPVVGGARVNISVNLLAATTNNVQATARLYYE